MYLRAILYFLILSSCQKPVVNEGSQLITFNIENNKKVTEIKLSDLSIVDIEYIRLETNDESLIQHISNLKIGEETFLVQHFDNILKFSFDGSFIAKIGNMGRGPDEFQNAHDVNINPDTKNVYVLSRWENKFYVYSGHGEFIESFSCPEGSSAFMFTDDGILCYNDNSQGTVTDSYNLIDNTGSIIKSFPNQYHYVHSGIRNIIQENIFYEFNNMLFKKEVYSDTIYLFENLNFIPYKIIEQGKNLLTPEARSDDFKEIHDNFFIQRNLFEFGDFIYYEFLHGIRPDKKINSNFFIGSKNEYMQSVITQNQGFINDVDGGPDIIPLTIKDDNTLISWINAFELKNHVTTTEFKSSSPKYPEKKKELEKLSASLDENDNPVLMLVKLKE